MTRGVITREEYEQLLAVELKAAYELMQQGVISAEEYERLQGASEHAPGMGMGRKMRARPRRRRCTRRCISTSTTTDR